MKSKSEIQVTSLVGLGEDVHIEVSFENGRIELPSNVHEAKDLEKQLGAAIYHAKDFWLMHDKALAKMEEEKEIRSLFNEK